MALTLAVPYGQARFPDCGESAAEIPSVWGMGALALKGASENHSIYSPLPAGLAVGFTLASGTCAGKQCAYSRVRS